jgi:hypothetical protein
MLIVGWFVVALAVWLLDSAIRNRPPITTLREIVSTGQLPVTGKSYPAPSHSAALASSASATGVSASYAASGGSAQVDQWITQAFTILAQNGVDPKYLDADAVRTIIKYESGGDPTITNTTDINAQEGHPSIGLMQTIGPTFNAYALPGHNDIRNPVDNIIAGVRYAIANYGGPAGTPGVKSIRAGGGYKPY